MMMCIINILNYLLKVTQMNELTKELKKCYRESTVIDLYLEGLAVYNSVSINNISDGFITFSSYEEIHSETEINQVIKTYVFRLECVKGFSYVSSNLLTTPSPLSFMFRDDDFTDLL